MHMLKTVYTRAALGRGVRREYWKAKHENVVVLDLESELIQLGITRIRDQENEGKQFIHDANSIIRATLDLAITELPNDEDAVVTTPRGHKVKGVVFEDEVKVCGITITSKKESQKGLHQVLQSTLPYGSPIGDILIEGGNKEDAKIVSSSIPEDLRDHEVLLLCPEFSSLEKIKKTIHSLLREGVRQEKITVVTLVTCPEAADKFCQTFGDSRLVTASFDAARDQDGYIIPGLGDFEERYTGGPAEEVPELESQSAKKAKSWWAFGSK